MPSTAPLQPASPSAMEYVSPFTSPAMPNLPKSPGSSPRKPTLAKRVPKSPLPPHRLAKLANALGIATPLPASTLSGSSSKRSFSGKTFEERSPLPDSRSATPATSTRSAASRYLIHVIPPKHFPHNGGNDPESRASFRRGTLVPLFPTLQAQLNAISREFSMPTNHGMVLYLVGDGLTPTTPDENVGNGPRINDEVWKWIWSRVAEEQQVVRGVGLGFLSEPPKTDIEGGQNPLRKLSSSEKIGGSLKDAFQVTPPSLTRSPSASTSASSVSKTPPTKQSSTSSSSTGHDSPPSMRPSSTQALETPATSSPDIDGRLLPGLGSPSIIPVLAKVEFDIDRQVGAWYETWRRSRRNVHKRQRNVDENGKIRLRVATVGKKGDKSPERGDHSDDHDVEDESGYAPLSGSEDEFAEDDPSFSNGDPLRDVFGTDADTWSDIQSSRRGIKGDLALDGQAISDLPELSFSMDSTGQDDGDEVVGLWNSRNRPKLVVPTKGLRSHPSTPSPTGSDSRSSARLTPSSRKSVPPPITITPRGSAKIQISAATPSPSPYSANFDHDQSSTLPYLNGTDDTFLSDIDDENSVHSWRRTIMEEKRAGVVYDDVDLGLDPTIDFADLEEDRLNQLQVREQLDVLERNLAQFSPRELKTIDLPRFEDRSQSPMLRSAPPEASVFHNSPDRPQGQAPTRSLSARSAAERLRSTGDNDGKHLVTTYQQINPARPSIEIEEAVSSHPPVFRQPVLVGTPSPVADSFHGLDNTKSQAGPDGNGLPSRTEEMPFSPISSSPRPSLGRLASENTSPNGKGSMKSRKDSLSVSSTLNGSPRTSSETLVKNHQLDDGSALIAPSLSRNPIEQPTNSPVLPLSPDPFGRFPSSNSPSIYSATTVVTPVTSPPVRLSSLAVYPGEEKVESPQPEKTLSSRFSADSVLDEPSTKTNRSTLYAVKSIRKLWKKNNKSSLSTPTLAQTPDLATIPSAPPSAAPSVLEFNLDHHPRAPSPSDPAGQSSRYSNSNHASQKSRQRDSGLDPFYFDQDSKYPVRRSPSPQMNIIPPPSSSAAASSNSMPPPPPPTEKKLSTRKSILRWKNRNSSSNTNTVSEAPDRSSGDLSEARRRRPSVLDVAGNVIRGSGSVTSLEANPVVPELPAAYRMSQQSRTSVTSHYDERPARSSSIRRKPAPTDERYSTDAMQSPSSLSSVPNGSISLKSPIATESLRSSFEGTRGDNLS